MFSETGAVPACVQFLLPSMALSLEETNVKIKAHERWQSEKIKKCLGFLIFVAKHIPN